MKDEILTVAHICTGRYSNLSPIFPGQKVYTFQVSKGGDSRCIQVLAKGRSRKACESVAIAQFNTSGES